jgi:long-chain fatty acid transport protein
MCKNKMNNLFRYVLASIFLLPCTAFSSGFQIPNQSLHAVGIAGAHVAYTPGPDSAYYNPANMSYLSDSWKMEASLTALGLPAIDYSDNRSPLLDGSSDGELFFLPQLHIASKDYHNFRFGFSLTYPFGLTKSWKQPFPAATAQQFSLFVVEGSPSLSYLFSEKFSIGGGVRIIYGDGEVENNVISTPFTPLTPLTSLSRYIDGNDLQLGYNLAMTFRPSKQWSLAATYRSEVELNLSGDATLQALAGAVPVSGYYGPGKLAVTLPGIFSLATSFVYNSLTFEITWNRTFWSSFEQLDFQYDQSFLGTLFDGFDRPVAKSWKDSDALRLGLTWEVSDKLLTTLGFAIDETPVPQSTLGFEMPDSDAFMYSAGLQYKQTEDLTLATSYMYHHTTSRSVTNQSSGGLPGIDGTFTDGGAHAVTVGLIYNF